MDESPDLTASELNDRAIRGKGLAAWVPFLMPSTVLGVTIITRTSTSEFRRHETRGKVLNYDGCQVVMELEPCTIHPFLVLNETTNRKIQFEYQRDTSTNVYDDRYRWMASHETIHKCKMAQLQCSSSVSTGSSDDDDDDRKAGGCAYPCMVFMLTPPLALLKQLFSGLCDLVKERATFNMKKVSVIKGIEDCCTGMLQSFSPLQLFSRSYGDDRKTYGLVVHIENGSETGPIFKRIVLLPRYGDNTSLHFPVYEHIGLDGVVYSAQLPL